MRYLLATTIVLALFSALILSLSAQNKEESGSSVDPNATGAKEQSVDDKVKVKNKNIVSSQCEATDNPRQAIEKSTENSQKIRELGIAHGYIDREISGLNGDINRQLTYSTIILGVMGLILTALAMFYVIPTFSSLKRKQEKYRYDLDQQTKEYKNKLEKIERESKEKLDKVVKQEYEWSKSLGEHLRDVSQISASTNLVIAVVERVSVTYAAEAVLNRAYRQTEKVDKLLYQYRNIARPQSSDCMEDAVEEKYQIKREALSQWIIETIDEGESFCDEASNKIREAERQQDAELNHEDKLISIRNDIKKKLDDLRIRTAVAKGLLYKRKFDLTAKRVPDLQSAIQSLQAVICQFNDSTTRNAKAKVYYNLACYQCLNGEPESAKRNLKLAVELNGRYALSAKLDDDLASICQERM